MKRRRTDRVDPSDATSVSVWRACGQVYGQLVRDSGLPGSDVLVQGGRTRRLLWLAALLTLVYYSASETGAIMREYFTYSVAVAFEYSANETFELPDVTVCNVNPLRRSKLCALEASERAMDSELERRICGKGQKFREANTHDLKLQQRISDWLAEMVVRDAKQVSVLGHQFTDTVVDCSYHEKDCKNSRYFTNNTNIWFGNCFCVHCEKTDDIFEYNALASPRHGLVMTLNPELHEYLPTSYQAGFLVMVHAHGTSYGGCYEVFGHPSQRSPFNALDIYQNQPDVDAAEAFCAEVVHHHGIPDCLNLCLQRTVVEKCGCLSAQLPQLQKLAKRPPVRLVLYFDSLTYEHIRSVPKYDETRVLSNLGGISGMYLGLSFFVLFQVLDILVVGALRLRKTLRWDARERRLVVHARTRSQEDVQTIS
ncbi:degenerin-like protein unc-105 [Rhipicephalus microplus]|uniref:degenerin-like protein unc-105 n=1 Tax=Rhipicephalus microplus TaxID=6941 RepID=UPI003F6D6CB3